VIGAAGLLALVGSVLAPGAAVKIWELIPANFRAAAGQRPDAPCRLMPAGHPGSSGSG
jgi:hypothetical protein